MNNKWELFQKFLITESADISATEFLINAAIVIVLSLLLSFTYVKCGKSLSNRKKFAANFVLLAFTTLLIIYVVKSSLALSLGLVGALSIVRFRSAIKEPEELGYIFFAIAIGLSLGANQRLITVIATLIIFAILWIRYFLNYKTETQNLFLTISETNKLDNNTQLTDIVAVVEKHFGKAQLKRFDESNEMKELSFFVNVKSPQLLQQCKDELQNLNKDFKISFIDTAAY